MFNVSGGGVNPLSLSFFRYGPACLLWWAVNSSACIHPWCVFVGLKLTAVNAAINPPAMISCQQPCNALGFHYYDIGAISFFPVAYFTKCPVFLNSTRCLVFVSCRHCALYKCVYLLNDVSIAVYNETFYGYFLLHCVDRQRFVCNNFHAVLHKGVYVLRNLLSKSKYDKWCLQNKPEIKSLIWAMIHTIMQLVAMFIGLLNLIASIFLREYLKKLD